MQPTQVQVEQCLLALHGDHGSSTVLAGHGPSAVVGGDAPCVAVLPPGLLEQLQTPPALRDDRLADARRRMAGGAPTDDDLARRMVGRLVCDRIR